MSPNTSKYHLVVKPFPFEKHCRRQRENKRAFAEEKYYLRGISGGIGEVMRGEEEEPKKGLKEKSSY